MTKHRDELNATVAVGKPDSKKLAGSYLILAPHYCNHVQEFKVTLKLALVILLS